MLTKTCFTYVIWFIILGPRYSIATYVVRNRWQTEVVRNQERKVRVRGRARAPGHVEQGTVLRDLGFVRRFEKSPEFTIVRGVVRDLCGAV